MDFENRFEKILGSVSKEKFRQNANKLLNECFILKDCSDTKNCYYFILKEKELYTAFFDLLGYDIVINEEYGIIAINNSFGTGRIRLRLLDSIILLLLRLIFIEEKKKELNDCPPPRTHHKEMPHCRDIHIIRARGSAPRRKRRCSSA